MNKVKFKVYIDINFILHYEALLILAILLEILQRDKVTRCVEKSFNIESIGINEIYDTKGSSCLQG